MSDNREMSAEAVRKRTRPAEDVGLKHHRDKAERGYLIAESVSPDYRTKLLLKTCCFTIIFIPLLLILLLVVFTPTSSFPVEYRLPEPPKLEGPLQVNNHLLQAEKLFEGNLYGPETIIYQNGHFYTGTADGRIVHIRHGEATTLARLGNRTCDEHSYAGEPSCGRPLGMKFDQDGYLVVADSYYGLFRINVATGDVHLLLPSTTIVNGHSLAFINSLDIASDGTIFFTDTSVYQRRDFLVDALHGKATGRLIRYDPVRNNSEVILNNLHFANGVQLSRYEDYLLVCETFAARIIKYHLKGIRAGHSEVFAENLPGFPDNVKLSSSGGYWVALPLLRHHGMSLNFFDFLASRTWLRLLLSKLAGIVDLEGVGGHEGTMIVEFNLKGEIVRTFMDVDGKNVKSVTEVEDVAGVLYLGSFVESYIARLDTTKLK